jgi:hypothetical protein
VFFAASYFLPHPALNDGQTAREGEAHGSGTENCKGMTLPRGARLG